MEFGEAPAADGGFSDFVTVPSATSAGGAENGGAPPAAAAPLDDFFSGSAGGAPATAAAVAAEFDSAVGGTEEVVIEAVEADPAAAVPPVTLGGDDEDAFFQAYTHTPSAPAPPPPEEVDPRVDWRKQNSEQLKKKDTEEAALKERLRETAARHLAKFYEVRATTLSQRKSNNRKSEAHQKAVEVPASGTPWEKVNALVNFSSPHQKDVSRYKALLITVKNTPSKAA
ncbi:hypothetical protein HYH03_018645 [Edaphochlamys debaryana]|uniref:Clathrin light chain n=1 Tax=Edaphochlamys debaryana TaxID=47281 RepID=A0A836BMX1_9CHLO|nr:hypothetical protein HYH03_018645 [Edaphochlamys debaryana]|eukprot:KAG2482410.1 hypothetical protein HYH03_018645 [Edaphochlamys debaryana]